MKHSLKFRTETSYHLSEIYDSVAILKLDKKISAYNKSFIRANFFRYSYVDW